MSDGAAVLQKCIMIKHEDYNTISIVGGNFKTTVFRH